MLVKAAEEAGEEIRNPLCRALHSLAEIFHAGVKPAENVRNALFQRLPFGAKEAACCCADICKHLADHAGRGGPALIDPCPRPLFPLVLRRFGDGPAHQEPGHALFIEDAERRAGTSRAARHNAASACRRLFAIAEQRLHGANQAADEIVGDHSALDQAIEKTLNGQV